MSITLSLREPGNRNYGGPRSPKVQGLSIEEYRQISPVEFELVNPTNLVYSDHPSCFDTVYNVSLEYSKFFGRLLNGQSTLFPLVCPIVIDSHGLILDGNHRAAASTLHASGIPAIIVDRQKDLNAIKKLAKAGVFYWPHSYDLEDLMMKTEESAQDLGYYEFLQEMFNEEFGSFLDFYSSGFLSNQGVYFNRKPFSANSLTSLIGTVLHNYLTEGLPDHRWTNPPHLDDIFIIPSTSTFSEELSRGLPDKLAKLASGQRYSPSRRGYFDSDDIVQEVLVSLASSNILEQRLGQLLEEDEF